MQHKGGARRPPSCECEDGNEATDCREPGGRLAVFIGSMLALSREMGGAWLGGFFAGANFGAGWKAMKDHSRRAAMKSAWTVDGRVFGAVAAARDAAATAFRELDGKARDQLDVGHGFASFQVLGDVKTGLLCHWNRDVSDGGSWAVLTRVGYELDD